MNLRFHIGSENFFIIHNIDISIHTTNPLATSVKRQRQKVNVIIIKSDLKLRNKSLSSSKLGKNYNTELQINPDTSVKGIILIYSIKSKTLIKVKNPDKKPVNYEFTPIC